MHSKTISKKAQQWSVEAMLAIGLFLLVFVLVLVFVAYKPAGTARQLELQTLSVYEEVSSERGFLDGNRLNDDKLFEWFIRANDDEQFDQFKTELGIANDFCIFFEDAKGNIVQRTVSNATENATFYGIGDSSIVLVGDVRCGQKIT